MSVSWHLSLCYVFHITRGNLASTGAMRGTGSLPSNKAQWQQQVPNRLILYGLFRCVIVVFCSSWAELLLSTVPVRTGLGSEPAPIMLLPFPTWHIGWVAARLKSEWGLFREFSFKSELKPKLKWQYKYIKRNISFQPKVFKSLLSLYYFQRKYLMDTWNSIQNL